MLSPALLEALLRFRQERDWQQFHNLRTLSVALAVESAELMELTQWARDEDLPKIANTDASRIADEIADITILLTYLINDLGLDVEQAVKTKLQTNAAKYPVAKAKGVSKKYDRLTD